MVSVRSIAGLQLSLVVDQPYLLSVADAADVSERRNLIGINLLTIEHRQTSERNDTGSLVVAKEHKQARTQFYYAHWTVISTNQNQLQLSLMSHLLRLNRRLTMGNRKTIRKPLLDTKDIEMKVRTVFFQSKEKINLVQCLMLLLY